MSALVVVELDDNPLRHRPHSPPHEDNKCGPIYGRSGGIRTHSAAYPRICGPGSRMDTTNPRRTANFGIPKRRARPAHTPPSSFPLAGRVSPRWASEVRASPTVAEYPRTGRPSTTARAEPEIDADGMRHSRALGRWQWLPSPGAICALSAEIVRKVRRAANKPEGSTNARARGIPTRRPMLHRHQPARSGGRWRVRGKIVGSYGIQSQIYQRSLRRGGGWISPLRRAR